MRSIYREYQIEEILIRKMMKGMNNNVMIGG